VHAQPGPVAARGEGRPAPARAAEQEASDSSESTNRVRRRTAVSGAATGDGEEEAGLACGLAGSAPAGDAASDGTGAMRSSRSAPARPAPAGSSARPGGATSAASDGSALSLRAGLLASESESEQSRRAARPADRPAVHANTGHGDAAPPAPESDDENDAAGLAGALCTLRRWPMRPPCPASTASVPALAGIGAPAQASAGDSSPTPGSRATGVRASGAVPGPPAPGAGEAAAAGPVAAPAAPAAPLPRAAAAPSRVGTAATRAAAAACCSAAAGARSAHGPVAPASCGRAPSAGTAAAAVTSANTGLVARTQAATRSMPTEGGPDAAGSGGSALHAALGFGCPSRPRRCSAASRSADATLDAVPGDAALVAAGAAGPGPAWAGSRAALASAPAESARTALGAPGVAGSAPAPTNRALHAELSASGLPRGRPGGCALGLLAGGPPAAGGCGALAGAASQAGALRRPGLGLQARCGDGLSLQEHTDPLSAVTQVSCDDAVGLSSGQPGMLRPAAAAPCASVSGKRG